MITVGSVVRRVDRIGPMLVIKAMWGNSAIAEAWATGRLYFIAWEYYRAA